MTATALLTRCRADGLELVLDPPDLVVRGPADARARYLPEIKASKPALLRLLTDHQEAVAEAQAEREAILIHLAKMPPVQARALAELAGAFYAHHWICPTCRAGTHAASKLHRPCPVGAQLWADYCMAAGRGVKP